MPVYVLGPDDPNNLGKISTNLCPYFSSKLVSVQVQSVNTIANIQILDETDYIEIAAFSTIDPVAKMTFTRDLMGYNTIYFKSDDMYTWINEDRLQNGNAKFPIDIQLTAGEHNYDLPQVITISNVREDRTLLRLTMNFSQRYFKSYFKSQIATPTVVSPIMPVLPYDFYLMSSSMRSIFVTNSSAGYTPAKGDWLITAIPNLDFTLQLMDDETYYSVVVAGKYWTVNFRPEGYDGRKDEISLQSGSAFEITSGSIMIVRIAEYQYSSEDNTNIYYTSDHPTLQPTEGDLFHSNSTKVPIDMNFNTDVVIAVVKGRARTDI
jgi:hypothetical protein